MFNRFRIVTLIACFLTSLWTGRAFADTPIEGIVFSTKGPIPGAVVHAYPDVESLLNKKNGRSSLSGEKPGQFRLTLPPGKYYLVAEGTVDDIAMFSYHGINPISITDESHWIPFFAVDTPPVRFESGVTGISGTVYYKGAALAGGTVSVYPLSDKQFRGMGLFTNSLDDDGRFYFDLEPGFYVVIARKRQQNSAMGPLGAKDLFCYPATNPIPVEVNITSDIHINCYPRNDLEGFLDQDAIDPRGRKKEGRRAASLEDTQINTMPKPGVLEPGVPEPRTGVTGISGRVLDLEGNPQAGLYVAAYPANGNFLFQMHILRLITKFITKTDADGRFSIVLADGGMYYLVAREILGEAPDNPERYGLYEGNANHSIEVTPGEQEEAVTIYVDRIMP
jgi:hypothetical protein